jgi:hypothetical protein
MRTSQVPVIVVGVMLSFCLSSAAQSAPAQTRKPKTSPQWKFEEFTDEMDGKKTQSLSQRSSRITSVSLYKPELQIICNSKDLKPLIVVAGTGPVEVDDDWTAIRYKFEENVVHEAQWRWLSTPASALMSMHGAEFLGQMLAHKNLVFEFQSLRSGAQVAEFDLSDLPNAAKKLAFCSMAEN